jgi:hypothetical protein
LPFPEDQVVSSIQKLSLSPNGKHIAVGWSSGAVQVYASDFAQSFLSFGAGGGLGLAPEQLAWYTGV